MARPAAISDTEKMLLEYVKEAKKARKTVWLSEAIEELAIDPHDAVKSAKRLEARGLLKPRQIK